MNEKEIASLGELLEEDARLRAEAETLHRLFFQRREAAEAEYKKKFFVRLFGLEWYGSVHWLKTYPDDVLSLLQENLSNTVANSYKITQYIREHASVTQLVEYHLDKVKVAGSNPARGTTNCE